MLCVFILCHLVSRSGVGRRPAGFVLVAWRRRGRAEGSEGVRLDPFPLARVRAGFAEITPLFLGFINRGIDSGVGRPRLNGWPPSSTPASYSVAGARVSLAFVTA